MDNKDNNETRADIIAEMRTAAKSADAGQTGYPECWKNQIEPNDVEDWADRIESAAERERAHQEALRINECIVSREEAVAEWCKRMGNAAAMREALDNIVGIAKIALNVNTFGNSNNSELWEIIDKCKSALAAPTRNCDVGTVDEQAERYHNFTDRYNPCAYRGYVRCAEDCPVHIKLTQEGHGVLVCQLEWAQMPYEGGVK